MTQELGGRHPRRGQFGDIALEVSDFAGDLIEFFSGEPTPLPADSAAMPMEDNKALGHWLAMESIVPIIDAPEELGGDLYKRAYDALLRFHVALPFSEAEREWLSKISARRASDESSQPGDLPRVIERQESRVMMAGIQRVISGRDLMRRWVAWRRETDEYAGQGSLAQARDALFDLRSLMG